MIIGIGVGIPFANQKSKIVVVDSFNRADSASLGIAETGQPWQATGSGFGISANKASKTTFPYDFAYVESNVYDAIIECDFTWRTGELCILQFRTDGTKTNRFNLRLTGTALELAKTKTTDTTLGSVAKTLVDGQTYKLKVLINGSSIKCYLDGVEELSVTDSDFVTFTKHGFSMFRTSSSAPLSRTDNFKVEAI